MKKARLLVVVLLAMLILLPYMMGFEIRSRYRGLLSQFEDMGYQLVSHEYDQGFFEAQARSELAIPVYSPQGESSEFKFKIVSDIIHGPYTLSGWLGDLTRFKSSFYQNDKPVFPADMNSQIETVIAFSGDGKTVVNLPALDKTLEIDNNLFLDFSGLQGQIDFNVVEGKIVIVADTDGLKLYSPGQGLLQIGKVKVKSDSSRGIADLMLGNGVFDIERFSMKDSQRDFQVNVENIIASADTYAEGSNVNLKANYKVGSILVNEERYGPVIFEMEFTSISAEAMARLQQSIQEMQQNQLPPEQQGMAVMGTLMSIMPAILEQNPGMEFKRIEVNTPQGAIKASLSIKADSVSITDIAASDKLFQKLLGDARMQVPETLVRQMLENVTRQQIMAGLASGEQVIEMPDPEEIQTLVDQQVTAQLDGLIGQGFLERNNGNLVAVASLKSGLLSVNGKMIPLPAMQQ